MGIYTLFNVNLLQFLCLLCVLAYMLASAFNELFGIKIYSLAFQIHADLTCPSKRKTSYFG